MKEGQGGITRAYAGIRRAINNVYLIRNAEFIYIPKHSKQAPGPAAMIGVLGSLRSKKIIRNRKSTTLSYATTKACAYLWHRVETN